MHRSARESRHVSILLADHDNMEGLLTSVTDEMVTRAIVTIPVEASVLYAVCHVLVLESCAIGCLACDIYKYLLAAHGRALHSEDEGGAYGSGSIDDSPSCLESDT
jgi:hypothetical protein